MLKRTILLLVMLVVVIGSAWAQGKYSIKEMTPEVQQALDARKERFSELRALKASGAVGESNQGYVIALQESVAVAALVENENRNRKVLYQTIAEQNGLQGNLSTIEAAFAQVQREKAAPGDKLQNEDGSWTTK